MSGGTLSTESTYIEPGGLVEDIRRAEHEVQPEQGETDPAIWPSRAQADPG